MTTTQTMEREIVGRFVRDVLASGRTISVSLERGYDLDEMQVLGSRDHDAIMDEAFAGDEAHLFVHDADQAPIAHNSVNCIGWAFIVLGSDGWDVINDYTTNLEDFGLMAGAERLSDRYSEEEG